MALYKKWESFFFLFFMNILLLKCLDILREVVLVENKISEILRYITLSRWHKFFFPQVSRRNERIVKIRRGILGLTPVFLPLSRLECYFSFLFLASSLCASIAKRALVSGYSDTCLLKEYFPCRRPRVCYDPSVPEMGTDYMTNLWKMPETSFLAACRNRKEYDFFQLPKYYGICFQKSDPQTRRLHSRPDLGIGP